MIAFFEKYTDQELISFLKDYCLSYFTVGTTDDSITVIFQNYNICLVFCPRLKPWILNIKNNSVDSFTPYCDGFKNILRL